MRTRSRWTIISLAMLCVLTCSSAQLPTPVGDFLAALLRDYGKGPLPKYDYWIAELSQMADSPPATVVGALPSVLEAVSHSDPEVKMIGEMALFVIGQRPDGATLIKPALSAIAGLLEDKSDPRIPRMAGYVLATMHPRPLPEVIPLVLTFVQRSDQNLDNRAILSELLMQWASDQPAALAAIENIAAQPLTPAIHEAFLDAIGRQPGTNERLNALVVAALRDPSSRVRRRAIYHVSRMGAPVLAKAASDLQRIAVDPGETSDNRTAAQKALRGEKE